LYLHGLGQYGSVISNGVLFIMAGQGKVTNLKKKFAVLSSNSPTNIGWTYHITTASTITLPDSSTAVAGESRVTFTKKLGVIPTIQRFGSTVLIKTDLGTDSSVLFDIEAEIIFVWNGVEWEV
jgi:hypothetical protein